MMPRLTWISNEFCWKKSTTGVCLGIKQLKTSFADTLTPFTIHRERFSSLTISKC